VSSTKIRSAAWVALRISLLTFGSRVLMLPLFSVVRRVFDGAWSVPWRMATPVGTKPLSSERMETELFTVRCTLMENDSLRDLGR